MTGAKKYLAEIGRRGGLKSRRRLSPEAARAMVAVREARRAFRRFHSECFASTAIDRQVTREDLAWVVGRLIRDGGEAAQTVGRRIARSISPRDTTRAAEEIRVAAVKRLRPADRIRQALDASASTRALALASLRRRYPERPDRQLVELLLGRSLPARGGRV